MVLDDFLDDIAETEGREEVVPIIDEHPLIRCYDGLQENDDVIEEISKSRDNAYAGRWYHILHALMFRNEDLPGYEKELISSDVEDFWKFVEARHNDFDSRVAGPFMGMLIMRLRRKGDNSIITLDKVTLDFFAAGTYCVTDVVINNGVFGDYCFGSAGNFNEGEVGRIYIKGGISGKYCFYDAGNAQGKMHDIRISGGIFGDFFGYMSCCGPFCDVKTGLGFINNLCVDGKITGKDLLRCTRFISNITINGTTLAEPSWEEVQRVAYDK